MDISEKYEADFFGQKFILSTNDGDKKELEKVVLYYKKILTNLEQRMPDRPHLDIAILAGLKITDKLFTLARNKEISLDENEDKIERILNNAIKRLDISLKT